MYLINDIFESMANDGRSGRRPFSNSNVAFFLFDCTSQRMPTISMFRLTLASFGVFQPKGCSRRLDYH